MPGRRRPGNEQRTRVHRAVLLLIAASWLLALVIAAGGSPVSAAQTHAFLVPAATATPTNTPSASATSSATSTPTAKPKATKTPTTTPPTATATNPPDEGIYNPNTGPQPTKVSFAQPTVGSGGGGALGALDPGAFGSNGLLLASSMSCVVAILGIIIAVVALMVLVRGGYGPFLRALALGKRAGKSKRLGQEVAFADQDWDDSGAYEFDGSAEYQARRPPPSRGQPGAVSRGRGYAAAPVRSRSDLRGGRESGERW